MWDFSRKKPHFSPTTTTTMSLQKNQKKKKKTTTKNKNKSKIKQRNKPKENKRINLVDKCILLIKLIWTDWDR